MTATVHDLIFLGFSQVMKLVESVYILFSEFLPLTLEF